MKKIYSILVVVAALVMFGCSKDRINYQGNTTPTIDEYGYLAFADGGLSVITDTEVVRADAIDVNNFICTIIDESTGSQVMDSFTYGNRPAEPVQLEVGSYVLEVKSGDIPAAEWESPVYGARQQFSIQPKQTTTLDDVKCKLSNIKVTLEYDVDLFNLLEDGSYTNVAIGDNSLDFAYTEQRAGYLASLSAENKLVLNMNFNYLGKSTSMTAEIAGVKAGQWRKITVNMPHADEGNVKFEIVIETITVDEEVVVDVAQVVAISEEIIPDDPANDPLAPIVTWPGYDIDAPFQLMASHFDEEGKCIVPVVVDVDANESVFESFVVNISSGNSAFMESLATMNFKEEFDICAVTQSSDAALYTALSMVGIPTGSNVKGKSSISVPLTNLMSIIYGYDGTHTFQMTITNQAGHTAVKSLVIVVDKASEGGVSDPSIVWVDHDIKQAYPVTNDLKVVINVNSSKGIAQLYVDILSDLLTKEELESVNLTDHLDLVNPGTYEGSLNGLGFPTSGDVLGKNELTFDISPFMSMLLLVADGQTCYANFQLTVVDADGSTTVETIKLLMN